jgi:hypothetical protein
MTLPKRPRDPAQLAKLMIDIASGEVTEGQPPRVIALSGLLFWP